MKPIILNVLLLLAFSSLALGQTNTQSAPATKCTLALARAPELRGLRLGMNQAQVIARFPGLSLDRADALGLARVRLTLIDPEIYPKGSSNRDRVQLDIATVTAEGRSFTADSSRFPDLKGVKKIQLRFVDGRISYVLVAYDDSVNWDSVDDFAQTVSKNLGLPDEWRVPPDSDNAGEKELRCEGFLMTAGLGGDTTDARVGAQLSLEDTAITRMIEKRQSDRKEKARRAEEERRKTFKP